MNIELAHYASIAAEPAATVLAVDLFDAFDKTVDAAWVILWTVLGVIAFAALIGVAIRTRNLGAVVSTAVLFATVAAVGLIASDPKGTAEQTRDGVSTVSNTVTDTVGG